MAEHQIPDWNEFCLRGIGTPDQTVPAILEGSIADRLIKAVLANADVRDLQEVKTAPWPTLFHVILSYKDKWSKAGFRIGDQTILSNIDFLYFDAKIPMIDLQPRLARACKYDRGIMEDLVVELILV